MLQILQSIFSRFGSGPVAQAIQAQLKDKLKSAEQQFIDGQKAILEQAKVAEEKLLLDIALKTLGELTNGN